jgi:N6-adenosine-specific RNA methylase IME4
MLHNRPIDTLTVVVSDPPWAFSDKLGKRGAAANYPTMSIDDIAAMNPMPADVSRNSVLFLWRGAAMQAEALRVVEAWGYELKSEIVWDKLGRPRKPKNGAPPA